jgi:hypothetical protein
MKLCQMVGMVSKKRLVTVVARKKIIPVCPWTSTENILFSEQNISLVIYRRYLEICPMKVHKTLPNGRQDICNDVSTGRCT